MLLAGRDNPDTGPPLFSDGERNIMKMNIVYRAGLFVILFAIAAAQALADTTPTLTVTPTPTATATATATATPTPTPVALCYVKWFATNPSAADLDASTREKTGIALQAGDKILLSTTYPGWIGVDGASGTSHIVARKPATQMALTAGVLTVTSTGYDEFYVPSGTIEIRSTDTAP